VIVDLWGVVSNELKANAGVVAIVGDRVRSEWGKNDVAPLVIIVQLGIGYSPMGQTRRTRIQAPIFAALCYGVTRVQASQLANAVVEAVELRGPRKDATGRLVYLSLVEGGGDVELDPSTKWPFATVTFTLIGSQRAVA
jgi:hypothetical protein